jgi:AraC family transcriptional regulator, ethanolamine operon transcriptional activator
MVFSTSQMPPAVTVTSVNDIADANSIPGLFEHDGVQLQSDRLHANRVVVRLPPLSLIYHSTNLRLGTRTLVQDGMAAAVVFGPRASGTVDGVPISQETLLLTAGVADVRFFVEPGYESVAVMAAKDDLSTCAAELRWDGGFRLPQRLDVLRADPLAARALFRLGKRIAVVASKRPHIFNQGSTASAFAQAELLHALFAATRSAVRIDPKGPARTQRSQGRIVRLAEDYALANLAERVHVADLCRITLARRLPHPAPLAPCTCCPARGKPGLYTCLDGSNQVWLLALRRVLPRVQAMLRRTAVGDLATPVRSVRSR